jgi:ubiquinone/menaquinone biosynthesis C-methylase UbiE
MPMTQPPIQFNDGAAYQRGMGAWSQLVGDVFLDWLAPAPGLRWADIGCGNGAFTALLGKRCAPAEIQAIDPSEQQLAFARTRTGLGVASFQQGDAQALPFANDRFDAAVMALVIHFVPNPAKGVAEMARVVRPGGTVTAYVWDHMEHGTPTVPIQAELATFGIPNLEPPSVEASRMSALREAWRNAGLQAIESREITVTRTFADFDELWLSSKSIPVLGPPILAMNEGDVEQLKAQVKLRLPGDADGRITYSARANAIKGIVPA